MKGKGFSGLGRAVFALCFCLLFALNSWAGAGKVSVGIMGTSFSYAEFSRKQILDKVNGGIFGLQIDGEYTTPQSIWLRGSGSWQTGTNLVYDKNSENALLFKGEMNRTA